ncbi:MAG: tRNA (adenosine(37)-N6)-threonylcarbamoyltransferase complex dimerization subunit type 1 TsaB [Candidatus Acidiferrales bacterium]
MKILAIDTSTQSGGVAVMEKDFLLAKVFEEPEPAQQGISTAKGKAIHANEEFSSRLFRYVASVLSETGLALSDIDVFAVTAGPGSFTGLRVGLTAVKAWSEVYGKPIAAISGLEAVAEQSLRASGLIVSFSDARRGQIFGGIFERTGDRLRVVGEGVVVNPREFIESVSAQSKALGNGGPVGFVSTAPEILLDALSESSLRDSPVEKVSADLAPWVGRLAFGRAQRGELVDALTLDANYVRRMDAELYWKDS